MIELQGKVLTTLGAGIVVFASLYQIVSYYPTLLHRKKQLGEHRLKNIIYAHRGSRLEGLPENTIAAFRDAVTAGADVIEMDVWLSKDGQVIVYHDETLSRMTQGACTARPFELEYKDYPRINPSTGQSERCSEYPEEEWQRIPLFEDALKVIPLNIGVTVEFKQDSEELFDKVEAILRKSGDQRLQNSFWFSLIDTANKKLQNRKLLPTMCSVATMLTTLFFHHIGLMPFLPYADGVQGIPLFEIQESNVRHSPMGSLPDILIHALAFILKGKPPYFLQAPSLFTNLRKRGVVVIMMGVNDEEDLKIAIRAGATCILTDSVRKLSKIIKNGNYEFHKPS